MAEQHCHIFNRDPTREEIDREIMPEFMSRSLYSALLKSRSSVRCQFPTEVLIVPAPDQNGRSPNPPNSFDYALQQREPDRLTRLLRVEHELVAPRFCPS